MLNGVLWIQTSVEYRAVAMQSYLQAREMLDAALADATWTAAIEQTGDFAELPPAVILDVDETVLDNSVFEARLVREGRSYDRDSWDAWCRESSAAAVPGAREFTRYAAAKGVAVYFVTNRDHVVEDATRRNLANLGFPLDPNRDTLYTRGEREVWQKADKTPRRKEIAAHHRILLLIGDNLEDFLSTGEALLAERDALADPYRNHWGTRWILLPNPLYGSWEEALVGHDVGLTYDGRLRRKYEALKVH